MSAQTSPTAEIKGKVGLKRKLTGPPRLLLGKSKSKDCCKEKEHSTSKSGSSRTQRGSMSDHQFTIQDEEALRAALENPQRSSVDWGESAPRDLAGLHKGPAITESKKGGKHSNSHKVKKHAKMRGWRQCCYPTLICLRKKQGRLEKLSAKEGDHTAGVSSCKTQSRSCMDSGEDNSEGDTVSPVVQTVTSDLVPNTSKSKTDRFPAGTWGTLKRLLATANYVPEARGGLPQQLPHFELEKSPRSHFSFKNKLGSLLKNRTKKPSPFFQERLVESHEYIEEENIVLSNKCVDDLTLETAPALQEEGYLEGMEVYRGSHSETLTVSVEVTAMALGGEETQNFPEPSMSSVEPTQGQRPDGGESQGYAEEAMQSVNGMLTTVDSSDTGDPSIQLDNDVLLEEKKETLVAVKDLISSVPGKMDVDFREAPVQEEGLVNDECRHSATKSDNAEEHEGVVEENSPPSVMAGESGAQDVLRFKNAEFHCALSYEEMNGAVRNSNDTSPIENLPSGDSGYQSEFAAEKLGPRCSEILLRQTAYALVQAAMKAALDQLEEEQNSSMVSPHTDPQELQGHA